MKYGQAIRGNGGRYLALILRLYVGGLFVYASLYKIRYVAEFAETLASYQLVPFWAVNAVAVVIPWTELFCGLLLVVGVRTRAAATLTAGMLLIFIVAVGVNLMRGTPIDCGCFQGQQEPVSSLTLLRDLIWLAMTVYVYFVDSALQLERRFLAPVEQVSR